MENYFDDDVLALLNEAWLGTNMKLIQSTKNILDQINFYALKTNFEKITYLSLKLKFLPYLDESSELKDIIVPSLVPSTTVVSLVR